MVLAKQRKGVATMKVRLDKNTIIEAAANMADKIGIANVTLKVLAEELGIKSPSLYKHFSGGLDELNKELMLYGWRILKADITIAAIGKSQDNAIRAICYAYRKFVTEHKGVFEAMQMFTFHASSGNFQSLQSTFYTIYA